MDMDERERDERGDNGGDAGVVSGEDVALAESSVDVLLLLSLLLSEQSVVSMKSFDFRARQLFFGKKRLSKSS